MRLMSSSCGGRTHLVEGLADGGEAWVEVFGDDDVVEADDGDVARTVEAGVFNGADGADGGGVVEAEDGGEVAGAGEQIAHGRIAELGRPDVFFEEDAEFGTDDDADLLRDADDGLPTGLGVEGVALAFHEGDAAVAEIVEMAERHAGRDVVIEHDVGDAGGFAVRGDADDGERDVEGELGIDQEKAIDAAAHEEFLVLLSEVGLAEMADGEVEKAFLEKILLDAEHDAGEVAFAEFGNDDADGVGEAGAQHAGVQVGAIVKFFCGGVNALLGGGGDRLGDGRVVENDGDGRGREVEILGEHLERHGLVGVGEAFSLPSSCSARMDVQHMATVVHLWLERRTSCRCDYESFTVRMLSEITK